MTKVCFVSTSSATYGLLTGESMTKMGGAELQQSLIASSMRQSGHEVSFLVHDFGQPDVVTTADGIALVKTFGLKSPGLLLKYAKPLRLFAGMDRASADVYYQRASGSITGLVAAYCKIRRRKFVFAIASDWDVDGTYERAMNPVSRLVYRYGVRCADVVVVQTDYQKELIEKRFGRSAVRVRNIYRMPDAEDAERSFVLWCANFHSGKRPDMLIKVAERLPEYRFVMVGRPMPGEERMYDEALAAEDRLPNLEVRGPVPYAEVGALYARALVFANTSKVEGFPNSFLDALSRRVPVVATFDPDEIICKYNLGVHCNTVDEMVSGIRRVLSNDELRSALGDNGYQYIKSMHEFGVVSKQYDDLLANLTLGTHDRAYSASRRR